MANKKKKKATVDIILPNYNSYEFIDETLKSIINQTYTNWKCIIVDDCSDKKTIKSLKKFSKNKKIKIYWLKKNYGAGYCRNYAIKKSKSSYIAFIDSDDIWKKDKLETQLRFMENNNYSFTYTSYETFGKKIKYVRPPNEFDYKKFIHNTSICTSTMVLKREILNKAKFTDTKICEDYFFKCELLKNCNAYCLDDYLTQYRIRRDSLQSNSLKNFYWIWKINREFNKLNILENLISLTFISFNSLIKYGFKNL
tara:strand:- start:250 stop:1011 length:762 start_codon:yes stop_codon:yes gene_type:complete